MKRALSAAVVMMAWVSAGPTFGQAPAVDANTIDAAVAAAVKYVASRLDANGRCSSEFPPANIQYGGKTALCAYALLTAGVSPEAPAAARAIQWLRGAKLQSTYAVAMRACAYAAIDEPWVTGPLTADVRWLTGAAGAQGGYTYEFLGRKDNAPYDNSNSQMALMAVEAGARRGVEVGGDYWKLAERHWSAQQQADGGWGYRVPPGSHQAKTYGSMSAAGLASLYICHDHLHREDFVRCEDVPQYQPIAEGLAWLAKNYSATSNPGIGPNEYYYWLYCLQRVGLASGMKHIAGQDWYRQGAAELLLRQQDDGSWGYGDIPDTCFGILFLARGRNPVLVNKLQYAGKWNCRPRDAANLAGWMSSHFERPVGWQVTDIESPAADWQDAPILYMSGSGPFELSDGQADKLRTYVLEGGMILSEAAGNNGDFTIDVNKLYKRLFPGYSPVRLGDDYPVYNLYFPVKDMSGLTGVSNGVRLLAVHCPRELSLALQLGDNEAGTPWFNLAANICLIATDKLQLRTPQQAAWPAAPNVRPAAVARVARVSHEGNCDPEPLAWSRLAALALASDAKLKIEVSPLMPIAALDANQWPLAAMTGTEGFHLAAADAAALKNYLQGGGTLIVDAAGGSKAFAQAVEKDILTLFPDALVGPILREHPIFHGPLAIDHVSYRRDFAQLLGNSARNGRLRSVDLDGRLAVIFSPDDLTAGLVGYAQAGIRGYSPDTAVKLMTNIVAYAAGKKKPSAGE